MPVIRNLLKVLPLPFKKQIYEYIYIFRQRKTAKYTKSLSGEFDTLSCLVAYNKIGGYAVPTSSLHRPAIQQILKGKLYEPNTIEFISKSKLSGDIVHAGTFFGDMLPSLYTCIEEKSKIWAFEPNKENYRCANVTKLINDLERVSLFHAGLGNEEKGVEIEISNPENNLPHGGRSLIVDQCSKNTETTNLVTIDKTIPQDRQVSLIHLDVEGYEEQALEGAVKTIKRCLPIIILETVPSKWVENNLTPLAYKHTATIDRNTVFQVSSLDEGN